MPVINPIILDGLKSHMDENQDIPPEMKNLVEKLLNCETSEYITKEGIDKIYDQILEQFISNISLVEWSKKYAS